MEDKIIWLRTDERKEALNALVKLHQFLKEVEEDVYNWKWVIIATHNATQGFMVLALKGFNSLNVYKNNSAKKCIDAYEKGYTYPSYVELDKFLNLYSKIKSEHMKQYIHSKIFEGDTDTDEAMKILNDEIRNNFIHFTPKSWSLVVNGLPTICLKVLNIIEFLVKESGNIYSYDEDDEYKVKELVEKIIKQLNDLELKYCI